MIRNNVHHMNKNANLNLEIVSLSVEKNIDGIENKQNCSASFTLNCSTKIIEQVETTKVGRNIVQILLIE